MSSWFSRPGFLFLSLAVILLLAQGTAVFAADLPTVAEEESVDQATVPHPALRLADQQTEVFLGNLFDREHRPFTIKLTPVGQDPLQVLAVRSMCPCLLIEQNPAPATLNPGEELVISAILRANMLAVGKFGRLVLVDVQGFDPMFVKVTGNIDTNVTFEPAPVIDLGNFVGQATTWERTLKMTFKFPDDQQLQVHQPEESKNFNLALTSPATNTFVVTATPKLPLSVGRVSEIISLPTSGIDGYGQVQIAFRGTVTGWELAVLEKNLLIDTTKTEPGKAHTAELTIVSADKAASRNPIRRRFGMHTHANKNDSRVAEQHVEKEEQTEELLKNSETWKSLAEKIKPTMPEGCSWEIVPENQELKVKLSFPNDFFQQRTRFTGTIYLEKKQIGRITIIGKK